MINEFGMVKKELKKRARKRDIEAILELAEIEGSLGTRRGYMLYVRAAKLGSLSAKRELYMFFYTKGELLLSEKEETKKGTDREIVRCFKVAQKWCDGQHLQSDNSCAEMIKNTKNLSKRRSSV